MSVVRPGGDQSSPADAVSGSLRCGYLDPGPAARTGHVRSCDAGEPGSWVLGLDGDAGAAFGLGLRLPRGAECPVRVGQRLRVHVVTEVLGIHPVVDASVCDADTDALILACSGRGDPSFAPGWRVEWGPQARSSRGRIDFWVHFTRVESEGEREREAFVQGNLWRRLETSGGAWLVCGHAVGWEPERPLPPDASSYLAYELLRQ